MRPSDMVLIRSSFGVQLLKKNPHAATQQPTKNAAESSATLHSKEGGRKNTLEAAIQNPMEKSISFLAVRIFFTKKPQTSSPVK